METPENIDGLLAELRADKCGDESKTVTCDRIRNDDLAFVQKILDSLASGSRAIFVAMHPDGKFQYVILNTSRVGSLALLDDVMKRIAEAIANDG
jgi:hypothetical protein